MERPAHPVHPAQMWKNAARRALCGALLGLLCLAAAGAPATAKKPAGGFWSSIQFHYKAKDLDAAIERFLRLQTPEQMFGKAPAVRLLRQRALVVFFASAFQNQPKQVLKASRAAAKTGNDIQLFILADAVAKTKIPDRDKALELLLAASARHPNSKPGPARDKLFAAVRQGQFRDYGKLPIANAVDMDVLWHVFFATGDPALVARIAANLKFWLPREKLAARLKALEPKVKSDPEAGREMVALVLGNTAARSLYAYGRQHARVRAVLSKMAEKRTDKTGKVAKSILASITSQKKKSAK